MRAVIQRVNRASVTVGGKVVGTIATGLVVLIGIAEGDTEDDLSYLVDKTVNLRVFSDNNDKFNLSVRDVGGQCLIVSQFTLLADTRKGRRPSFESAARPEEAQLLFQMFVDRVTAAGIVTATGRFQEKMLVEIHNDGPVTIMIDSRERFRPRRSDDTTQ